MTEDALPRRFQDTMSRFGSDDATSHTMTLAPFFFDVLHLDGVDLLDGPLAERARDTRRSSPAVARTVQSRPTIPTRPPRSSPTRSPPGTKA